MSLNGSTIGLGMVGSGIGLSNNGLLQAGVFDDPFFFDLAGFQNGLMFTGDDFFAGADVTDQWVEATIALSIIITAINNLFPLLRLKGWVIAFTFGLVHGFGFANVLMDLGLSSTALAVSLLGFNVGVELGQMAIVLVFLPVAYLLRDTTFYRRAVLQFGSIIIALIAGIWMYERLFNVEIIGF